MESAPLRPVPSRPPGAIAPAEAVRFATRELPGLDGPAAEALALIALAGRSREEVGGGTGLSGDELADALARARKALRRRLHPLPGSGWCERAERLISDRIDGALEAPGPARLKAHLVNCSRCVEHERRLAQAQDALVTGFLDAHAAGDPGYDVPPDAPADAGPARLSVLHVVPSPALLPPPSSLRVLPVPAPPAELEAPAAEVEGPAAEVEAPAAEVEGPAAEVEAPAAPTAEIPPAPAWRPPAVALPAALPAPPRAPLPAPAPWQYLPPPRPVPASRAALEAESTWTTVGPLVVVLMLAVAVFALAGVLATGV
ncbi:MAG: zf-HC2 domain-containing protein [Thermoleophilaceae bacterium]